MPQDGPERVRDGPTVALQWLFEMTHDGPKWPEVVAPRPFSLFLSGDRATMAKSPGTLASLYVRTYVRTHVRCWVAVVVAVVDAAFSEPWN